MLRLIATALLALLLTAAATQAQDNGPAPKMPCGDEWVALG